MAPRTSAVRLRTRLCGLLVALAGSIALADTTEAAAPSIAVSDFLDLRLAGIDVASAVEGDVAYGCKQTLSTPRFTLAPGCSPPPWLDASARPSIARLRHSLLNMRHIFNESARTCAAADAPRFVPACSAPPDYCVHSSPHCESIRETSSGSIWDKGLVAFDQNLHERIFLARHLQSAHAVCDPADAAACDANIVVVPSLFLHLFATHGFTWGVYRCATRELAAAFWSLVRRLYFDGRAHPPLVVVAVELSLDGPLLSFVEALSEQPAAFQSVVVVANRLSRVGLKMRRSFGAAWSDDALVELQRREALVRAAAAGRQHGRAAPAVDFGGPLLVSVPAAVGFSRAVRSWGVAHGAYSPAKSLKRRDIAILAAADIKRGGGLHADGEPNQYVRFKMMLSLRRHGANCTRGLSLCARCVRRGRGCPLSSPPRSTLFTQLLRSHMCFEPPGDLLDRSHLFAAILSGCVPILVEGGHRLYDESRATSWPWRRPLSSAAPTRPGDPQVVPPAEEDDAEAASWPGLDYSRFAVVLNASAFGPPTSPRNVSSTWLGEVTSLVRSPLLRAMRTELERVAPLFVYALDDESCAADAAARAAAGWRPPAGVGGATLGPPCDAFDMYRRVLARAWRVQHQHRLAA